ncbi:MAG: hypothetical protein ACRCYS_09310 [Beijerinckiaceae bacterium]
MADGASLSAANRLPPAHADRVLIACAVGLAADVFGGDDADRLLDLLARALPLATSATRIERLRSPCHAVLAAAPRRHHANGSGAWCVASLALQRAVVKDALAQAIGALE